MAGLGWIRSALACATVATLGCASGGEGDRPVDTSPGSTSDDDDDDDDDDADDDDDDSADDDDDDDDDDDADDADDDDDDDDDDTTGGDDDDDDSGGSDDGTAGTGERGARCPEGHECFFIDGVFHVPDEAEPTFIQDLAVIGAEFSALEVELEFTHGGWYPDDPAGLHNLFWLHRGQFGDFTWMGGVAGYVNTRGPGTNIIRTRHDLDVESLDDSQTFNINGVALAEGTTYRAYYRYDTVTSEVIVRITEGENVVAMGTDVPTTDAIRNDDGGFFIWVANDTDVAAPGPEVPSLGWSFANLRVEFIP